jgi:hypothetical protein
VASAARLALLVSLPVMALILASPAVLDPIGVEPRVAASTRAYTLGPVWNTLPLALFAASRAYLQAVGAARAIVVATIIANVRQLLRRVAAHLRRTGAGGGRLSGRSGLPAARSLRRRDRLEAARRRPACFVLFRAVGKVPVPPDPLRRAADWATARRIFALGLRWG